MLSYKYMLSTYFCLFSCICTLHITTSLNKCVSPEIYENPLETQKHSYSGKKIHSTNVKIMMKPVMMMTMMMVIMIIMAVIMMMFVLMMAIKPVACAGCHVMSMDNTMYFYVTTRICAHEVGLAL